MIVTAALFGCAEQTAEQARAEQERQDLVTARDTCAKAGIPAGTPDFAQCVQENVALLVEQQQRAGAVPAPGFPVYGQPARPDNRMCLPTAAGAAISCF
jgi:tRNA U34 2-thiouridine synthase MnmA/TrmU